MWVPVRCHTEHKVCFGWEVHVWTVSQPTRHIFRAWFVSQLGEIRFSFCFQTQMVRIKGVSRNYVTRKLRFPCPLPPLCNAFSFRYGSKIHWNVTPRNADLLATPSPPFGALRNFWTLPMWGAGERGKTETASGKCTPFKTWLYLRAHNCIRVLIKSSWNCLEKPWEFFWALGFSWTNQTTV